VIVNSQAVEQIGRDLAFHQIVDYLNEQIAQLFGNVSLYYIGYQASNIHLSGHSEMHSTLIWFTLA